MTLPPPPIETDTHEAHIQRLMLHARQELEAGDRLQASEKAWGAVAHRLKVVAAERGWRYDTHSDAFIIVRRLSEELGDDRIDLLFSTANGLHRDYYIDAVPLDELYRQLDYVEELIEMLDRAGRRS